MFYFRPFIAVTALVASTLAHPGEKHDLETIATQVAKRDLHVAHAARALDRCVGRRSYEKLLAAQSERLAEKYDMLRMERGIPAHKPVRRNLAALKKFEKENYNLTSKGYTKKTKPAKLFANYKNVSCILTPEVTQGPYWITGEYIRKNVAETQKGVSVHLEYQYIDVSTCKAAPDLYLDTWQANATGVYSGVVASGNGNSADSSNINSTFLRGMQKTNAQGYAAFDTIFAGHYQGRATHIHLIAHQNGTVLKNKTYSGGTVSHVGQLFFPTDLKDEVEATAPYNTNTQAVTTNNEDMWAPGQADNKYDPFPDYAYLGDDISDGLLMWINVGIDLSASYDPTAAGELTANGGVASSSGGGGPP